MTRSGVAGDVVGSGPDLRGEEQFLCPRRTAGQSRGKFPAQTRKNSLLSGNLAASVSCRRPSGLRCARSDAPPWPPSFRGSSRAWGRD